MTKASMLPAGARKMASLKVRLGQVKLGYIVEIKIVTFGCDIVN